MKNIFILAAFAAAILSSCEMPDGSMLKQTWSFGHLSQYERDAVSFFPQDEGMSDVFLVRSNFEQGCIAVIVADDKVDLAFKSFRVMTGPFFPAYHNSPVAYTRNGTGIFFTLEPGS